MTINAHDVLTIAAILSQPIQTLKGQGYRVATKKLGDADINDYTDNGACITVEGHGFVVMIGLYIHDAASGGSATLCVSEDGARDFFGSHPEMTHLGAFEFDFFDAARAVPDAIIPHIDRVFSYASGRLATCAPG